MLKKMMMVLGVAAMLATCVGCGKEEEVKEEVKTTSIYEETVDEAEETSEEIVSYVYDLYVDTFKEIYGDDFDADKLVVTDDVVSYEGKAVSWDYVEELAYNSMTNQF